MVEIDDAAIISAIRLGKHPASFSNLMSRLDVKRDDFRQLDKQLQRLRRAGVIKFQQAPVRGWVVLPINDARGSK